MNRVTIERDNGRTVARVSLQWQSGELKPRKVRELIQECDDLANRMARNMEREAIERKERGE